MKSGFYRALAWSGITKNKKLYMPYILTCIGMVMMCYIISFLSKSPAFESIKGGMTVQSFLEMGFFVMSVFSAIFLFYTNSFLIRRRKKEFGLYNILGVGKNNLAYVLLLENLIIAAIALAAGLFFGILFSKLSEMVMLKLLQAEVTFIFSIELSSVLKVISLFLGIFALIFANALLQIHLSNPIQLLRSENVGEKAPKANWLVALLGAVILGAAYYIAVTTQDPLSAIMLFFGAVIMVIVATYMLFQAGSVTLCRLLQKNKKYYYKTNHFVSVSSMAYRMKRNGAGLASICILSTMVLVMISTTVCLFIGGEASLRNRYPRNISITCMMDDYDKFKNEVSAKMIEMTEEQTAKRGLEQKNIFEFYMADGVGMLKNNRIVEEPASAGIDEIKEMIQVFVLPVEDYNRLTGKNETLNEGEAIIYTSDGKDYPEDTIQIGDSPVMSVVKQTDEFIDDMALEQVISSIYLVVPDFGQYIESINRQVVSLQWYYGFDLDCDDELQKEISSDIANGVQVVKQQTFKEDEYCYVSAASIAAERADFMGLYKGLFFLGILLGIVFIFAAVLIIYYKQISEGYEDKSRFEIMQKVGMTKREIKKSINSQILTVFFLPLMTAGVHLAFAFPIISKIMIILGMTDIALLAIVTAVCFGVFALFYVAVYNITSRAYFSLVSEMQN